MQVDPDWHPNIDLFREACLQEGVHTIFHQQSDLECPIEDTDLLFIDTWHVYGHLKRELARWHPHVRKYILLHDTVVDAVYGESIRCNLNVDAQSRSTGIPVEEIRKGLMFAVNEFLQDHPEWVAHAHFPNNNGLTVLTRCRSIE